MEKPILLIEDNDQNRYLATFLLEKSGYSVITASDGLSAIEMAKEVLPGLILLDIQLPLLDGYQVARLMRQDGKLRNVPIIAVTSYAMPGDHEAALACGCDGYIEKPIDPDTFVSEIRTYLRSEGA